MSEKKTPDNQQNLSKEELRKAALSKALRQNLLRRKKPKKESSNHSL